MHDSFFISYKEIVECKTEAQLGAILDRIAVGYSGVPTASCQFNWALDKKQVIDWVISRARDFKFDGVLQDAKCRRSYLVNEIRKLLE